MAKQPKVNVDLDFYNRAIHYLASDGMIIEEYDEDGEKLHEICKGCYESSWGWREIEHADDCLHEIAARLKLQQMLNELEGKD